MKCQSPFSGKNKINILNLLSVDFAQRVVKGTFDDNLGDKLISPGKHIVDFCWRISLSGL